MKDWNNLGTPIEHRPMPPSPGDGATIKIRTN